MKNYQYPLELDWTTAEMITVTQMWTMVEKAYEEGVVTSAFNETYQAFKQVVKSIGEEKRLGKQFEELSGYSLYRTVQAAKTAGKRFKMKG